jgi:hypothetical protein
MRRLTLALAALTLLLPAADAAAWNDVHPDAPRAVGASQAIEVAWRAGDRVDGTTAYYVVNLDRGRSSGHCTDRLTAENFASARRGSHLRVQLDPSEDTGAWCRGSYRGTVLVTDEGCLGARLRCHSLGLHEAVVARFSLRVR